MLYTGDSNEGRIKPAQSHEELQALVGRALVDASFRRDLLNGHRRECLAQFGLTADEYMAASNVKADDITTFAQQLDMWIKDKTTRATHLVGERPRRLAPAA
jgi:hypothetical protein